MLRSDPAASVSTLLKKGVFSFLLLLPLALWMGGNSLLIEPPELEQVRAAEDRLDAVVNQLEYGKEPVEYFSRVFRQIEKKVFSRKDPLAAWKLVAPALRQRYPGMLELLLIDGEGSPVPGWCDRQVPRNLLRKFLAGYQAYLAGTRNLAPLEVAFVRSFFGDLSPVWKELHGQFFLGALTPVPRYVYFSRPGPKGMFIVFFTPPGLLREVGVREQIRRINRHTGNIRLTLAKSGDPARKILQDLEVEQQVPTSFWKVLQRSSEGCAWFRNTLVMRRYLFPNWWVVARSQRVRGPPERHPPGVPLVVLGIVLFVFFTPLEAWGSLMQHFAGSVRVMLIAAFLYTAMVPLLLLGATVQSFLADRKQVLISELHQKTEDTLVKFDRSFQEYQESINRRLDEMQHSPRFASLLTPADFGKVFPSLRKRLEFGWCLIFDHTGKCVSSFTSPDSPIFPENLKAAMGKMSLGFISRSNPSLDTGRAQNSADPLLLTAFQYAELIRPFCTELQAGSTETIYAPILLAGTNGFVEQVVFFAWEPKAMQWNYIRRVLPTLSRNAGGGRFLVWPQSDPDQFFPPDFPDLKRIRHIPGRVISGSQAFHQLLSRSKDPWIVTGVRGTRLRNFSFLSVNTPSAINAILRSEQWQFRFLSLAVLGICAIIGTFLARLFIIPVNQLSQGLEAIVRRDFDFRLEIASTDELGQLGEFFNLTLEDLRDLEVAQTLQESFFPIAASAVPGVRIFGSCIPAAQVGGDYYDYFPVGEGNLLMILGDVSGHGVGAALVVAMAKALIEHPLAGEDPEPILQSMNEALFRILGRKKMMTSQIVIFHPRSRHLTLSSAGQTFPILIRSNTAAFIPSAGYPLGSVRKWKAGLVTTNLEAGDVMVFYSDGIVEALTGQGEPVGYERLLVDLPGLVRPTPQETEQAIRAWHRALAPAFPPDDDSTLVIAQTDRAEGPLYE